MFDNCFSGLCKYPDILVFTETWLTNDNVERANIDGYTAFHTIRSDKRSGGVSIFVHNNVSVSKITELSLCTPSIESCVVSLEISSTHNLFIVAL